MTGPAPDRGIPMVFPRVRRGFGRLTSANIQEIIRHVSETPDRDVRVPFVTGRFLFVVEALSRAIQEEQSLDRVFEWEERQIDPATQRFDSPVSRSSTTPDADPLGQFGSFVTAPASFLFTTLEDTGVQRHVYMPATQLLVAKVVVAFGKVNVEYRLRSVDNAFERDFVDSTPLDRWPGVDYEPRAVGDLALILIPDSDILNVRFLAFETPIFATCPVPAAAAPMGGVSEASILGL